MLLRPKGGCSTESKKVKVPVLLVPFLPWLNLRCLAVEEAQKTLTLVLPTPCSEADTRKVLEAR